MALAAGLLMGAAMKPDLEADNRPAGPQVIAEGPAAGSTGPFDDRTQAYAAYRGEIPDYVLGTDWKRQLDAPLPVAYADAGSAVDYYESPLAEEERPVAETGTATPAVYPAPPEPHGGYPSLNGAAAYSDDSRAEKTPVVRAVEVADDAPPEATGDTTPAR